MLQNPTSAPPSIRSEILEELATPALTRGNNRQTQLMNNARASASFKPRELSRLLYGGEKSLRTRERAFARVEAALGTQDTWKLPVAYTNMDRVGAYHEGLRFGKVLMEDQVAHQHGVFDRATHNHTLINASPYGLHPAMFLPTLKLQASDEQLQYWLPLAESGQIIGTYCQTELGHGTFLRGLETTATFDLTTDEFVLHSPTLTSTKYWPGGLGFSCSHAIVMARLIIASNDHGVHPFIVQLRSLSDYKPLPGIELGDIGLKMGLNSTDNGFAVFRSVRIPRMQLLMRNSKVLRDGTYIKAPHDKLAYSTMIFTRNLIIHTVSFQLAQALTIAIRYSTVREQGVGQNASFNASSGETTIMNYRSQHYRLFTSMARAFALVFASQHCEEIYQSVVAQQRQGNHSGLAYGHITTAALKAYATSTAADGAEDARKCCGGHGYTLLSGLPDIVATVTPTATLEGENYVMYQQCARYLVKCAARIREGKGVEDERMKYLEEGHQRLSSPDRVEGAAVLDWLNWDVVTAAYQQRASGLTFDCEELLRESQSGPQALSPSDAWNEHMMLLIAAAQAHIELFVLRSFISTLTRPDLQQDLSPPTLSILSHLLTLYTHSSLTTSPTFLSHSFIRPSHLRQLQKNISTSLKALLPEAVALTDTWAFTDAGLNSAIGMKDGNCYERLMEWTRQVPINSMTRLDGGRDVKGFEGYTRGVLVGRPQAQAHL